MLAQKGFNRTARQDADFIVEYRVARKVKADQGGMISPTNEADAAWNVQGI
ncbi:hypothetical protein [Oceanicoccus sp. KOV_DT_Chl]|uniref:hypothetical protein n=1 Tax=Oceanicoccus sp. KOV_DT_Chl TaxID=1904639 RepID=UPI0013575D25|nr:hypothetical protein [Oceanicoccus sp. KOV_DT_Chl]